jgi:hypothetical protein
MLHVDEREHPLAALWRASRKGRRRRTRRRGF